MEPTVIVLIVVVVLLVIALVVAGVLLSKRRRSAQLRDRYGAEYERTLAETGNDPHEAEARLLEREKRHRGLDVRDLRPEERDRFGASWAAIQRDFVDDPVRSLQQADGLVVDIMRTRGYPVDDFERRAQDISVEHPDVVTHYREARSVREATEHGPVDTEQQRHAVTSYRSLVEALLGSEHRSSDGSSNGSPTDGHRTDVPTTEEQTR